MLSSVPALDAAGLSLPVAVRLIGVLDRVVIDAFGDVCDELIASGRRTLIVSVRDLQASRDVHLSAFCARLEACSAAGFDVRIAGTPIWTKLLQERNLRYRAADPDVQRSARRQTIIAHTAPKRAGAA
jgi:hypothetical protein